MLSVTFVLSRFDSNNLNSAICLIKEFYGTIKLIELEHKNECYYILIEGIIFRLPLKYDPLLDHIFFSL